MDLSGFMNRIVSISLFNQGKASKLFHRVKKEGSLVVVKNNTPIAIIISPEEYKLLYELPSLCSRDIANNGSIVSIDRVSEIISQINNLDEGASHV